MNNYSELIQNTIQESIETKQKLINDLIPQISEVANFISDAVKENKLLMFCGNGGSAADAQHIVAELVIRFRGNINRRAIKAMALTVDPSIMTAGGNDIGYDNIFAREVEAYASAGDILIGISTSGNSPNVKKAIEEAKQRGAKSVALLGGSGGEIKGMCDYEIIVPSKVTARVQESHILIGHIICDIIERNLFPEMFE